MKTQETSLKDGLESGIEIPHQLSVLITGDSLVTTDLENMIKKTDHRILATVKSGEELIEMAKELSPDVILMDIGLESDLGRMEIAKTIRNSLNIPIVFLSDGTDAVEILKTQKFDILTIDINMPKMNGFKLLKHVKKHYKDTKCIYITATSTEIKSDELTRQIKRAYNYGLDGYIIKPYTADGVQKVLEAVNLNNTDDAFQDFEEWKDVEDISDNSVVVIAGNEVHENYKQILDDLVLPKTQFFSGVAVEAEHLLDSHLIILENGAIDKDILNMMKGNVPCILVSDETPTFDDFTCIQGNVNNPDFKNVLLSAIEKALNVKFQVLICDQTETPENKLVKEHETPDDSHDKKPEDSESFIVDQCDVDDMLNSLRNEPSTDEDDGSCLSNEYIDKVLRINSREEDGGSLLSKDLIDSILKDPSDIVSIFVLGDESDDFKDFKSHKVEFLSAFHLEPIFIKEICKSDIMIFSKNVSVMKQWRYLTNIRVYSKDVVVVICVEGELKNDSILMFRNHGASIIFDSSCEETLYETIKKQTNFFDD